MLNLPSKQDVLGVGVSVVGLEALQQLVDQAIQQHSPLTLHYANAHTLNMAWTEPRFRTYLNQAQVVWCDGFSVLWWMSVLGVRLAERFTWVDVLAHSGAHWGRQGYRIFWLGAEAGVADLAAQVSVQRYAGLGIAGAQDGYFGRDSAQEADLLERINASGADMLFVGMGSPLQEAWIARQREKLQVPVIFTVGAGFDYVSGVKQRAPRALTHRGLEWLARLIAEPRRMWRRYLLGLPMFAWRALAYRYGIAQPRT